MFSESMDPARDAGVVAGTVLIPMRFVWPYGGRSVFLSGSFTRWSELLPMSPVEGCPTVYQVIYSLPPGYHQYKFFVDGEWRHDEHQPYVPGQYGIVNTVLLATDPNYIPVITSNIASGNSMDVDNEAFRRTIRLTDGTLSEVLPRISDTDVQISRQRISAFLSMHTAYELLPESGKVVALDVDLPVKQAFHILHEQGIYMAPLWDLCKGQFVGVLSVLDFILILRELGNHGSNLTEEELETHTISAWKEGKSYLNRQNNGPGTAFSRRLIHAGPYDNLKDIAMKILQKEISTVPIIHSSSEDGSFPQLLHLASLSGILKCICRYFKHCTSSLPILHLPICTIPVGTWVPKIGESNRRPLAMLRPSSSLASALNLLVQAQVSSIPIVDDNDSLLDIYCRSDITALAKDRAYTHINLDEMTVQQALQLGQDAYSPYELRSQRCQMCLRSDSLHKVMERLANPGNSTKSRTKKHESKDRWSAERYKLAEQNMWEVLKAEGATFENPITRPALRLAARKHIGDTGLLDHLLKHIDGKVAPGGAERFRRWFNTNGIMEYWLESADLDKVRQEAGVQDPYWLPPSTFRAGSAPCQNTDSSGELKLLKIEMAQMKKDMQELVAKKQEKNEISVMEETHKEFVKWKAITDHRLTEIINSLKSVQCKYGELVIWKTEVEQHLVEITNKLNDLQAPRECTTFSPPSERWKDWIGGSHLDNIQEDAFPTWIGSSELLNVPQEAVLQDPNSAIPTQPLNEELTNKKSDVPEVVPTRQEDQPNVTPDSSTTVNSKSDLDNSLIMFQEMYMDLYKWKEKMEQQLLEVSNTVYGMLAMKQTSH